MALRDAIVAAGPLTGRAETQLRRATLTAARDEARLQDMIECAELALAQEEREVAEAFYGLVFLEMGFAPSSLAMQARIRERTGLWPDLPPASPVPPVTGLSVELAIDELRRLMQLAPSLPPRAANAAPVLPDDMFSPAEPKAGGREALDALAVRVMALARTIPQVAAQGGLADMLRGVAYEVVALQPILLEEHLGRDIAHVAALYALERLRVFLFATHEILTALPVGSPLFEEASRLDPGALGPYFFNMRRVMRNARDIFALLEVAGGEPSYDAVECWSVLLSARLSRGETLDLIDELGDRGMHRALRIILGRASRSTAADRPRDIVWRVRDVALDIGNHALAADAQQVIALWAPTDANEWMILGTIRAAGADTAAAEEALARSLLLAPSWEEPTQHLARLRAGERFTIEKGYGTSLGRLRLRQARLRAFGQTA